MKEKIKITVWGIVGSISLILSLISLIFINNLKLAVCFGFAGVIAYQKFYIQKLEYELKELGIDVIKNKRDELPLSSDTLFLYDCDIPREIKFRAWDTHNNCMITDEKVVYLTSDGLPLKWMNDKCPVCAIDLDLMASALIIMQRTPLNGKNGKDVYEGDIVKYKSCSWIKYITEYDPLKWRTSIIVWSDEELCFGLQTKNGEFVANLSKTTDDNNFEVIGNIYENPELSGAFK